MKYRLSKSKEWKLLKIIAIGSLIVCIINLASVWIYPALQYEQLMSNAIERVHNNGFLKQIFRDLYGFVWQSQTDERLAQNIVKKEISISRLWGMIWFLSALAFNWLVFDWYYAKYIISGIIYISLVGLYMIIPTDFFPDFIPLAGQADDILIDLFGSGFGLASFVEAWKRRNVKKMLEHPHRADIALDLICKEYGFEVQGIDDSSDISKSRI